MRNFQIVLCALLVLSCERGREPGPKPESCENDWSQWGLSGGHAGTACAAAQPLVKSVVDLVYDPFVADEMREAGGSLVAHYQSPLIAGDDVYMEAKVGNYVPCAEAGSGAPGCGANAWEQQIWTERKYHWTAEGAFVFDWRITSDWKPPPNAGHLGGWEPVFHAALGGQNLWIPAAAGGVWQVARGTGAVIRKLDPFSGDALSYVAGPVTVDAAGNAVWPVIRFAAGGNPWSLDAHGAIVRATPAGAVAVVSLDTLIPGAPAPTDRCELSYSYDRRKPPVLPLLDANGAIQAPPTNACGTQRPQLNSAPATGPDGSIYFVSRAHRNARSSYLVALAPDLSLKWAASFRDVVQDGCGVTVAKDGQPGHCRANAPDGIDPDTGRPPAQTASDNSTASPVVLPDGAVIIGGLSSYNGFRGHLLKFGANGAFLAQYPFGWDTTPSVFKHDGTYSIVLKDNEYVTEGPYYITQLGANLGVEWKYKHTNIDSCARQPDGTVACRDDGEHHDGFEWCVNGLAIDGNGVVYANSEDGHLYSIYQGGTERQRLFLNLALGAAYTPLALDAKGRIYTQNAGHLYVVGAGDEAPVTGSGD